MHALPTTDPQLTADLIGFTAGLAISLLLLALTLRAARIPGTAVANILLALCALLWNTGGLAHTVGLVLGIPKEARPALIASATQFTGVAVWPIVMLAIWHPLAVRPWQKVGCRILQGVAVLAAAGIALPLWSAAVLGITVFPTGALKEFTSYNGSLLLALAAAVLLRGPLTSRAASFSTLAILVGVFGGTGALLAQRFLNLSRELDAALGVASKQSVLLIVLGAFLLFARFRFADVFLQQSLRILMAGVAAVGLVVLIDAPFLSQWAASTLEVAAVRVIELRDLPGSPWPAEIHAGETVELASSHELQSLLPIPDVELLVPVGTGARVSAVVAVAPGPARRGLVSQEVEYLRSAAVQLGARLDLLKLEREMVERQHHEALLQQQLTEAELRALRAQVNPHFLFNSLNTIADLIVTNPIGAEAMTIRLARVFRHVLSRSSRALTSLSDEIAFLRSYLEIEEARFGGRLQVDIDVPVDVASESIPSLILQPLVENALKHGLAPKPGPGHLRITARAEGVSVRVTVEDDGLGPGARAMAPVAESRTPTGETRSTWNSTGVGLTNVAQRLDAVYRDGASVSLEPRETGGTRVTIVVPRTNGRPLS